MSAGSRNPSPRGQRQSPPAGERATRRFGAFDALSPRRNRKCHKRIGDRDAERRQRVIERSGQASPGLPCAWSWLAVAGSGSLSKYRSSTAWKPRSLAGVWTNNVIEEPQSLRVDRPWMVTASVPVDRSGCVPMSRAKVWRGRARNGWPLWHARDGKRCGVRPRPRPAICAKMCHIQWLSFGHPAAQSPHCRGPRRQGPTAQAGNPLSAAGPTHTAAR